MLKHVFNLYSFLYCFRNDNEALPSVHDLSEQSFQVHRPQKDIEVRNKYILEILKIFWQKCIIFWTMIFLSGFEDSFFTGIMVPLVPELVPDSWFRFLFLFTKLDVSCFRFWFFFLSIFWPFRKRVSRGPTLISVVLFSYFDTILTESLEKRCLSLVRTTVFFILVPELVPDSWFMFPVSDFLVPTSSS